MPLQSGEDKYSKRNKLWEQSFSDSEIAEFCGVSKSTIGYWRSNNGLKSNRTRGRQLNKGDVELRFKLINEGYSDSDIASIIGISRQSFTLWRQNKGIYKNKTLPQRHEELTEEGERLFLLFDR